VVATLDGRTAQKDEVGLMMATGVARAGEAAPGTAEMTDTPGSSATT